MSFLLDFLERLLCERDLLGWPQLPDFPFCQLLSRPAGLALELGIAIDDLPGVGLDQDDAVSPLAENGAIFFFRFGKIPLGLPTRGNIISDGDFFAPIALAGALRSPKRGFAATAATWFR